MNADAAASTVLERFAQYAQDVRRASLDAACAHHAKRAVLDWLGATLAGLQTPEIARLMAAQADDLDRGAAFLLNGRSATPRAAALVHGAASHVLELDDIFRDGLYHPGGPVIAAALAVAAECGASGDALMRAVVVGYEISSRIAAAVNPQHYRYWHTTGTVGCIGAAAAAATLYELDAAAFADALAHATSFAAGLQQAFRSSSDTKPLHVGHAADAGVFSARVARHGLRGAHDMLEGEAGFGMAMSASVDWPSAVADLGASDAVPRIASITFKAYACCGQTFAAVDAVLALKQDGLNPAEIESLVVESAAQALKVTGNANPHDANEARFSLAFVLASTLLYGAPLIDAFSPARLTDTATRALMPRISGRVDAAIDAVFPKERSARVIVRMRDGSERIWLQRNRRGDPEWPLDDAALQEKFLALVTPVHGEARAKQWLDDVWRLDNAFPVRGLTESGNL